MTRASTSYDVVVIGGGLMGAGVTRQLRDAHPDASILIVDAGTPIGDVTGLHLHDTDDEALWSTYNARVSAGVQALYMGATTTPDIGSTVVGATPGMYHLASFGADASELPASAIAWNAGGMGVHWTAATPTPWGVEVFDFGDSARWNADLATAQRLLHVEPDPYGPSPARDSVLSALDEVFGPASAPGRHVQPMPMAVSPSAGGRMLRTGPSRILPALATGEDPDLTVLVSTICTRVIRDGDRVTGAALRNTVTGEESHVSATVVVVCADAVRTPQLLWASGIRPAALGRNMNEHAFLTGRVVADLDRLGIDVGALRPPHPGEAFSASDWLPHSDAAQPFQGQIMSSPIFADDLSSITGYLVGLSWYVPTDTIEENGLEFSDDAVDPAGLPRIRTRFRYSDADRRRLLDGQAAQAEAGNRLGEFDPERDSAVLAPGSSLHYTGTVRMGLSDDGSSVCDPSGRVWGTENLFVAGNGVVPTPLTANSTLPGMVTAVRAARGVSALLG
jgi:choline dehydrogenase-like flavoprotein